MLHRSSDTCHPHPISLFLSLLLSLSPSWFHSLFAALLRRYPTASSTLEIQLQPQVHFYSQATTSLHIFPCLRSSDCSCPLKSQRQKSRSYDSFGVHASAPSATNFSCYGENDPGSFANMNSRCHMLKHLSVGTSNPLGLCFHKLKA